MRGAALASLHAMPHPFRALRWIVVAVLLTVYAGIITSAASTSGGALPGPLPLFPADNWWNLDISAAPVDPGSAGYIAFINNGSTRALHPDFGGDVSPGSVADLRLSVRSRGRHDSAADACSSSTRTKATASITRPDRASRSIRFRTQAITQPHWIEGGEPGNVDLRSSSDRHLLIVDRDQPASLRALQRLLRRHVSGTRARAPSSI